MSGWEIKTTVINELIVKAITTHAVIGAFAPMIATVHVFVQSCFQPILTTLEEQQHCLIEQKAEFKPLNSELKQRVEDLEFGPDDLKQYGRKTYLRF